MKPPPISRKPVLSGNPETDKQIRRVARRAQMSVAERLLKGSCYVLCFLLARTIAMLCLA